MLRLIYFKEMFAHRFEDLVITNKLEGFFFSKKHFFVEFELFSGLQNHSFGCHLFAQKINLYFFSSVIIYFQPTIKNMP